MSISDLITQTENWTYSAVVPIIFTQLNGSDSGTIDSAGGTHEFASNGIYAIAA